MAFYLSIINSRKIHQYGFYFLFLLLLLFIGIDIYSVSKFFTNQINHTDTLRQYDNYLVMIQQCFILTSSLISVTLIFKNKIHIIEMCTFICISYLFSLFFYIPFSSFYIFLVLLWIYSFRWILSKQRSAHRMIQLISLSVILSTTGLFNIILDAFYKNIQYNALTHFSEGLLKNPSEDCKEFNCLIFNKEGKLVNNDESHETVLHKYKPLSQHSEFNTVKDNLMFVGYVYNDEDIVIYDEFRLDYHYKFKEFFKRFLINMAHGFWLIGLFWLYYFHESKKFKSTFNQK